MPATARTEGRNRTSDPPKRLRFDANERFPATLSLIDSLKRLVDDHPPLGNIAIELEFGSSAMLFNNDDRVPCWSVG